MYGFLEARVQDYMTRKVLTISPQTTVQEIERLLTEHDFNGLPVVDRGSLVGVVTKFDLLAVFVFTSAHVVPKYEQLSRRTAREIMTTDVLTFPRDAPLTRVLEKLVEMRVKSFPVVEDGRLVGIVAREDIVRALRDATAT